MVVLIVDDSEPMRKILIQALQQSGVRGSPILEAKTGEQAIRLINRIHPDLVISDWEIPGMKGIELLDSLRRSGCQIPFGFVTSEDDLSVCRQAFAAGASFFLTKPLVMDSFRRAIKPFLGPDASAPSGAAVQRGGEGQF